MVFVTVNCAPMTAADWVESIQVTGGAKLTVDCKVNPTAFVGQERTSSLPLVRALQSDVASFAHRSRPELKKICF